MLDKQTNTDKQLEVRDMLLDFTEAFESLAKTVRKHCTNLTCTHNVVLSQLGDVVKMRDVEYMYQHLIKIAKKQNENYFTRMLYSPKKGYYFYDVIYTPMVNLLNRYPKHLLIKSVVDANHDLRVINSTLFDDNQQLKKDNKELRAEFEGIKVEFLKLNHLYDDSHKPKHQPIKNGLISIAHNKNTNFQAVSHKHSEMSVKEINIPSKTSSNYLM